MEQKQSKFDLLDSMMNRLGVAPSMLTMEWLKNRVVPFVCVPKEDTQDGSSIGVTSKILSAKMLTKKSKEERKFDTTAPQFQPEPVLQLVSDLQGTENEEPVQEVSLFYNQDWEKSENKFELSKNTISQLRCGMFAYLHGSKIVITKKTLSSQKVKNQNYTFAGVVFDLQENILLTLSLCSFMSSYSKLLKKLSTSCRLPTGEECERIFVYKDNLHRGFELLNINFKEAQKIFYGEDNCPEGKIGVFDFKKGTTTLCPTENILADVYQIKTIEL